MRKCMPHSRACRSSRAYIRLKRRASSPTTSCRILRSYPSAKRIIEELNTMASGGWIGAKIYDALLLRGAARCAVERIYTFNLGDFRQLAPAGLQEKICAP